MMEIIIEGLGTIIKVIWTLLWGIIKILYETDLVSQSAFVQSIIKPNFNPTNIVWLNKALFVVGTALSSGITFTLSLIGLKSLTKSILSSFVILLLSLFFVTHWIFWLFFSLIIVIMVVSLLKTGNLIGLFKIY